MKQDQHNTKSYSTGYQGGEEEATQAYSLYVEEPTPLIPPLIRGDNRGVQVAE